MPPQPRPAAARTIPRASDADQHPATPKEQQGSKPAGMPAASPQRERYTEQHNTRIRRSTKDRLARYVFDHRDDDPAPTGQTITDLAIVEFLERNGG